MAIAALIGTMLNPLEDAWSMVKARACKSWGGVELVDVFAFPDTGDCDTYVCVNDGFVNEQIQHRGCGYDAFLVVGRRAVSTLDEK